MGALHPNPRYFLRHGSGIQRLWLLRSTRSGVLCESGETEGGSVGTQPFEGQLGRRCVKNATERLRFRPRRSFYFAPYSKSRFSHPWQRLEKYARQPLRPVFQGFQRLTDQFLNFLVACLLKSIVLLIDQTEQFLCPCF